MKAYNLYGRRSKERGAKATQRWRTRLKPRTRCWRGRQTCREKDHSISQERRKDRGSTSKARTEAQARADYKAIRAATVCAPSGFKLFREGATS